jgi:O-succinylbenzoate synthase
MRTAMSLRLARISLREIKLGVQNPAEWSLFPIEERRVLLLSLTDSDGITIWSECSVDDRPTDSPETIDTAWLAIANWLGPRILGTSLNHPTEVDSLLNRGIRGHRSAKATIEMGTWALWSIREGHSLAHVLGGKNETFLGGIVLAVQPTPDILVDQARHALSLGYQKITICIQPGADIEYLGAAREALGPKAPLAVDGMGTYSLDHADHLSDLCAYQPLLIEQPLAPDDLLRHAELQDRIGTSLCLDESITHIGTAEAMLSLGAGRIINIKASRVGGFTQAKAIYDLCQHHAVAAFCGSHFETGIGRAYSAALASLPHLKLPSNISPSARYWREDTVTPKWEMTANGSMTVPIRQPGLGVTVDVDMIDNHTVRTKTLVAP